jgi:uncharacterized protein
MADMNFQIEFGGKAVDTAFYDAVLSLTVAENTTTASFLRLRLRIALQDDGTWNLLEDERLQLFERIKVSIGFVSAPGMSGALSGIGGGNDEIAPVFEGYITGVAPLFDSLPDDSVLEVQALDSSVLLSLEDKVATWPDASDSDIVEQIVSSYGVQTSIEATQTTHSESDTTVIQRGTDIQFVRELAQRNGAEFYFETDADSGQVTAFFRPPQLDGEPQSDLAIRFGEESNLRSFSVRLTGLRPLSVKVLQIDVKTGDTNTGQASDSQRTKLGAKSLSDLVSGTLDSLVTPLDSQAQMLLLGPPTSDEGELTTIGQATRDEAAWCIEAQGEINSEAYQAVLRPHRLVQIKGAGQSYCGKYYVTRVGHELEMGGDYTQKFEALRNARDLDGSEQFGAAGLAVSILGV